MEVATMRWGGIQRLIGSHSSFPFYNFIIVHKLIFFAARRRPTTWSMSWFADEPLTSLQPPRYCEIAVGNAIRYCGPQPTARLLKEQLVWQRITNYVARWKTYTVASSSLRVLIPVILWMVDGAASSAATKQFANNEPNIVAVAMCMER